ncbi:MAG: 30S ribosome-binding factor RbfA [Clostridia bacterium]|nr:30S ribosome-binding factor RbfA [Clostridia bacterium]
MKNRTEKINAELQREIYDVISRGLKHPDLTEMISIVRVECTPDLKYAKVFVSVYSGSPERQKATFAALKECAPTIRYELAHRMRVRTVPALTFVEDDSMAYSMHISKMLKELVPETEEEDEE